MDGSWGQTFICVIAMGICALLALIFGGWFAVAAFRDWPPHTWLFVAAALPWVAGFVAYRMIP